MKRLAYGAFWVMVTLAVLWAIWKLRIAVFLFLLALAVARAFRPIVRSFARRGVPHGLSVILAYGVGLVILAMTVAAMGPSLIGDTQRLINDGLGGLRSTLADMQGERGLFSNKLISVLVPNFTEIDDSYTRDMTTELASYVIGVTSSAFTSISYFGLVIVISLYWSFDRGSLVRWGFSRIGPGHRTWARQLWERSWTLIGEVVRAESLISLTLVLALWALYSIFNIPYLTVFALWAGIARVVPWLGIVLAFMPLLASGMGLAKLLVVIVLGVLIFYLVERVWQRAVLGYQRPSRLFTGVLILALGKLYGLIGVILAPPVAAVCHELLRLLTPVGDQERQILDPRWDLEEIDERLSGMSVRESIGEQDDGSRQRDHLIRKVQSLKDEVEELLREKAPAD